MSARCGKIRIDRPKQVGGGKRRYRQNHRPRANCVPDRRHESCTRTRHLSESRHARAQAYGFVRKRTASIRQRVRQVRRERIETRRPGFAGAWSLRNAFITLPVASASTSRGNNARIDSRSTYPGMNAREQRFGDVGTASIRNGVARNPQSTHPRTPGVRGINGSMAIRTFADSENRLLSKSGFSRVGKPRIEEPGRGCSLPPRRMNAVRGSLVATRRSPSPSSGTQRDGRRFLHQQRIGSGVDDELSEPLGLNDAAPGAVRVPTPRPTAAASAAHTRPRGPIRRRQ